MPFSSPFRKFFGQGDLVYGLAPMRPALILHLQTGIINNANGVATVDQYKKSMEGAGDSEKKMWLDFLRDISLDQKYGRYVGAIQAFNGDEDLFNESEVSASNKNSAWRAKSKFGLQWTIGQERGHIHFVLDGVDMGELVTKTHRFAGPDGKVLTEDVPRGKAPQIGEKERTITYSELRWIFRNRSNRLVQERVQFWLVSGFVRTCMPPWEDHTSLTSLPSGKVMSWAAAWRHYSPTKLAADL